MKTLLLSIFVSLLLLAPSSSQAQDQGQAPDNAPPVFRLSPAEQPVKAFSYPHGSTTVDIDFLGTYLMPKAHGVARVKSARGGFSLQVRMEGLGRASEIDPAYLTYVLWAMPTHAGNPQNLGEFVLKGDTSTLNTFTTLNSFALIVTAEPYFAVKQPSMLIVLENILRTPSENPDVLRADLLPLRMDSKTPLEIYEARNAVRIARLSGAERYSTETFHRALQLLQQAESLFAHKSDKQNPELREKAREAIEAAEQARLVAAEQLHQPDPLRPDAKP